MVRCGCSGSSGGGAAPALNPVDYMGWRAASTSVKTDTGSATLHTLGDSIVEGATGWDSSWTADLVKQYRADAVDANMTYAFGGNNYADPRIATAGFAPAGTSSYWLGDTVGDAITYTPSSHVLGPATADTVEVYVYNTASVNFTVSVNGGPALPNGAPFNVGSASRYTIPLGSVLAAPSITLTVASAAGVVLLGFNAYDSTESTIRVGDFGISTTFAQQWALSATNVGAPLYGAMIPLFFPADLTIVGLGVNDAGANRTTQQYIDDMTTIINAMRVNHGAGTPDILLQNYFPSANPPYSTNEALYVPALFALAKTLNSYVIDVWNRFGGDWNNAQDAGMALDTLHPNALGSYDISTLTYRVIDSI